jgi:sec-independent protein translocase protein TatA
MSLAGPATGHEHRGEQDGKRSHAHRSPSDAERIRTDPDPRFARTAHMPNIGPMELIVVLAIALMVLGPKRLPEVGRSVGRSIREFKASIGGDDDDRRHEELVAQSTESVRASSEPVAGDVASGPVGRS